MEKRVILKPKSATKSTKTEQKKPEKEILPTKIENNKESSLYVKQLCALAISNIAYLRSLLPEDCFQNRSFLDTSVTLLKNSSATCSDLEMLSNWLVGAFDAIDKKYLETLTFGVFVENPEVLIEGYEFKFTYTEADTQMILSSGDSKTITDKARLNSKKLLRALILMTQTIKLPPDNAEMNIKLHYYDYTPDDYEPPFFRKAKNLEFEYDGNKKTIEMGDVKCFWHQLNLTMNVSEHMLADEDKFEEALEKKNLNNTTATVFDITKDFSDDSEVQEAPKRNNHVKEIDEIEEEIAPKSIQCPCKMIDANDHMVECKMCATIQHAVCFKLQDTEKKQHICHTCSLKCAKTPENIELIENDFAKLDDTAVKKLCLIRRCSYKFIKSTKLGKIDIERAFGKENSTWLIKQLVNDNQIKLADKKKHLYVIIDANETLRAYFNRSLVVNSQGSTNNDSQLDRPTSLPIAVHVEKTPIPQPQPQQTVQFSKETDKHSSEAISGSNNKFKQVFKTKRTRKASEPSERDDNDKKIRTK